MQKTPDFIPVEANSSLDNNSGPSEDPMLSVASSGQEIGHAGALHVVILPTGGFC